MQRLRKKDSLQGFMNSFKQFEKKLDKLQEDVHMHGNTLSELRVMVSNLAASVSTDNKLGDPTRLSRKSIGVQYEKRFINMRQGNRLPLTYSNKLTSKSFLEQPKINHNAKDSPFLQKMSTPMMNKHRRIRKQEAPRKATTLRNQKGPEKHGKTLLNKR
ncbi:uncharacterized protein LOC113230835 [Hyposmocoma kahamanoa]|uniref:uncharacterized protein LOC113230835 n=1 Tax=Hyposmocoma kahamanoa TaxID=1477025 RepID=UPI000E6D8F78|nr:uncharacterized protein LOC113230835 [Hyposmocoma kahamanoa]